MSMAMFARLSLGSLSQLCRTLRQYLHAGLTLRDAVGFMSRKGSGPVQAVCSRIGERLAGGDNLETALKPEGGVFPHLFVSLVVVGEASGMLVEVFGELEKFYIRQQTLRREFL